MNKKCNESIEISRPYSDTSHFNTTGKKKSKGQKGHLLCKRCLALYHDKHWYTEDQSLQIDNVLSSPKVFCPGCYRIEKNLCHGTLSILGSFKPDEAKQMMALIAHVESECWRNNPSSRIINQVCSDRKIVIRTTTAWLAKRLGTEIKNAFHGNLETNQTPETKSVALVFQRSNS